MAGIYIHIPFCKQACHYCNFHFSTSLLLKEKMIQAIMKELVLQRSYLGDQVVETIYFGGGTPSLLLDEDIKKILDTIYENFTVAAKEITLEGNPDDLTGNKLTELKESGINRLSIGIQSFLDADLLWMNRAHNADQSALCIKNAIQQGFTNISADLIYGIPDQTDEQWKTNIQKMIDFGIPHISCYALTVEPNTALQYFIEKKKTKAPDEQQAAGNYATLREILQQHNYDHYEISNFAKDKRYALHNTAYWKGKWYLGVGPSAHSFNGTSRQWNVANNALYIQNIEQENIPFEAEMLSTVQQANETVMTSLRTMWGLDLAAFKENFGEHHYEQILFEAKSHLQKNNLVIEDDHLLIAPQTKFIADGIISDLFLS
ncbi:MAG: radical SAM family heme chaperone HemW [Chitinophagales bacterium]|nr:radical SAM family heme chaperone HemW [Chitinophagales bacterium]